MNAVDVYVGSDGDTTLKYYAELQTRGPIGVVAVNLFRAQKCSARAKVYRGRARPGAESYRALAYDRKNWSMEDLSKALLEHGAQLGITWGWKADPWAQRYEWVLYVDLPGIGQVSFHSAGRKEGPDYPGEWDKQKKSAERICAFCDQVFHGWQQPVQGVPCESNANDAASNSTTQSGQQSALTFD